LQNGKPKWEGVGRVGVVSKSGVKRLFNLRQAKILQGKLYKTDNRVMPTFLY